jgi:4-aminobutyrate aminotransferase/(S)-3-amino-2-methylpropionate transaminase
MEENNLNQRGIEVGEKCMQAFESLQEKYPEVIGDVRGLGAMVAFELVHDGDSSRPNSELCAKLLGNCAKRNTIIISAGTYKNVIRILSPLTIPDELLEKGLGIITEEFEKLMESVIA